MTNPSITEKAETGVRMYVIRTDSGAYVAQTAETRSFLPPTNPTTCRVYKREGTAAGAAKKMNLEGSKVIPVIVNGYGLVIEIL